jgi:chromosome condensin MukBEF ATPase and DNA-binding subunit MukB
MSTIVKTLQVKEVNFKGDEMYLLTDEKKYVFDLNIISKKLLNASDIERMLYKISPSGYGIHWPLIDEDLSIQALIQ